jgi:gliding motility-associated-like protein
VIPAGQTETFLPIVPIVDSIPEPDETLIITILNAVICGSSSITDTIIIRSVDPLRVTIPSGAVRCGNSLVALTALPSGGDGPLTYTWQPGGYTGQTIQVAPNTTTTYYVTVEDTCGNQATDSVTVYVAPNPDLTPLVPLTQNYCEGGSSVTLAVFASGGTPGYDYVWSPSIFISQQNQPQVQVIPTQTTILQVYAVDSFGCYSDTISFLVNYHKAPKLVTRPSDTIVCAGTTFSIQAMDTARLSSVTYQWTPVAGLSNPNSAMTQVTVDTSIVYQVVATNPVTGCVSAPAFVSITARPLPIANAGPDKTICPGDSVMIGGTPIGTGGVYTYQWTPATGLSNPTIPNPMASPSTTTEYRLVVSDGICLSKPDTVRVEVLNVPSITPELPSPLRFCPGDSVRLLVNANLSGPYQLLWTPATGLSDPYVLEPYAAPDSETTYYLSIFLPTCALDSVVAYTVVPKSVPLVDADTVGDVVLRCYGLDSVTLYGKIQGPYDSFYWSPKQYILNDQTLTPVVFPPETRYYYLNVMSDGCRVSDSVLVRVIPSLQGAFSAPQSWVCFGDSMPLTYQVPFQNALVTWSWSDGSQTYTSIENPLWIKGDSSRYYFVTVTSPEGRCAILDSLWIETKPSVQATFYAADTRLCTGEEVLLEAPIGGNVRTWWYIEDGSTYTDTLRVSHSFTVPGIYDVTLVVAPADDPTCKDTLTRFNYLVVVERARADFTSVPSPSYPGDSLILYFPSTGVQFHNQSEGNILYTWWFFGDGDSSRQFHAYHTYAIPGVYLVTLVVEDGGNCRDTVTKGYYVVREPAPVRIPNVFTPNGDGINDLFSIEYEGVETFQVEIYDGWGNLIFRADSPAEKWDGRLPSGQEALPGVYYYVCRVGKKLYKGNITLIR